MRQYNFRSGGKYYRRVNTTTARRIFNEGGAVIVSPCNLRPDSVWTPAAPIAANDETNDKTFDIIVNEFIYYNCKK